MAGLLDGVRVLVVEDRSTIAMALCDAIEEDGGVVVGPAARLAQANRLIEESAIDVGVLDVDLDGEASFAAAKALHGRRVPVLMLTGYHREAVPEELGELEMLEKPVSLPELVRKVAAMTRREAS